MKEIRIIPSKFEIHVKEGTRNLGEGDMHGRVQVLTSLGIHHRAVEVR
jgi:hypothetical protein